MRIPSKKTQLLWIYLLLLIVMSVGFFLPISKVRWTFFVLKVTLFFISLVVFYLLTFANTKKTTIGGEKKETVKREEEEVGGDAISDRQDWAGFGEAFRRFYETFLSVVRNSVVASGAAIYLRKGEELEFLAGENKLKLIKFRFSVSADDIVSHVADERKIILEGNLPLGMSLAGINDLEIRSFLGVPLILRDKVVGVLAVGSEATESFGDEDKELLKRCGEIIAEVMSICRKGIYWEMDQSVYNLHLDLEDVFQKAQTEEKVLSLFVKRIGKVFSFDRFTMCSNEGFQGEVRYVFGAVIDIEKGFKFPLNEGLNGWILKRNVPLLIADMEEGDYIRPRYHKAENLRHGLRSYLGIPLGRKNEGAEACISLESKQPSQYSEKGKEVLSTLAVPLQMTLERIRLQKQLEDLSNNDSSSLPADFQLS